MRLTDSEKTMSDQDSTDNSRFEATLRALAANYAAELPAKLAEIASMFRLACEGGVDATGLQLLHRQVHSLNGSAKTFGFPVVSDAARKFELALVPSFPSPSSLDRTAASQLLDLLDALLAAGDVPQDTALARTSVAVPAVQDKPGSGLLYLLESDSRAANALILQMGSFAYTHRHFPAVRERSEALGHAPPSGGTAHIAT